ncbi:MAG: hypothetical protein RL026_1893 [Pseudomonadota bacterium]
MVTGADNTREWSSQGFQLLLAGLLLLALVGGGSASGTVLDAALIVPALLLLVWAAWRLALAPERRPEALRRVWLWPALLLALPLLQVLPLPPALWAALPGRQALAEALRVAGVEPAWRPLSVFPQATLDLALGLLVPVAVFVAAATLNGAQRRLLLLGVLGFAVLSALLGLVQMLDGYDSSFYLHPITNRGSAVGFFANRNHLASLLAVLLPVATGRLADRVRHVRRPEQDLGVWLLAGVIVVLAVGVTATTSRAGLLLMMLSVPASLLVLWRGRAGAGRHGGAGRAATQWLRLAGVVALGLMLQYTLYTLLLRMQQTDALEDGRWQYAGWLWQAAAPAAGVGWGLGSFEDAHDEVPQVVGTGEAVLNHAHNEYLELWLEGGLPALLLALAALVAVLRLGWQAWQRVPGEHHRNQGQTLGAAAGLLLLALHSALDYPLRTTALACVAALLLALLNGSVRARRDVPAPSAHSAHGIEVDP